MNESSKSNEVVGMDFIGPVDGRYLILIVDYLSRRVQVEVCKKADRDNLIASLQRWVREYGPVRCLITDQGLHFMGEQVQV